MASSFLFHKGLNGREHEVGLPTINNSTARDSLSPVGSDVCNVVTGSSSFVSATFILRYRMHPLAFGLGRQNKKKPSGFHPNAQSPQVGTTLMGPKRPWEASLSQTKMGL